MLFLVLTKWLHGTAVYSYELDVVLVILSN